MEAVATHARRRDLARQREGLRQRRLAAVEGGIEAGDLRQVRRRPRDEPALVPDCAAGAAAPAAPARQARPARLSSISDRRGEFSAAMDDTMAEGQHRPAGQELAAERQDLRGGAAS